ncbi:hypothetical protein GOD70_25980 [Sinorhizobium medicae]|nr:hypothetical protein [Sinorhizobium medicae]MDX0789925.1 hypothetical protein [Sinorhizobium medicae]MDX1127894.1 hypothetical protein [Sinorhizobium medicae]MDX1231228.1 hypothetical protein [Sinorhizobium medicae]
MIFAATGRSAASPLNSAVLDEVAPGISGWIAGKTLKEIETSLGGNPEGSSDTAKMCPRARELIATFIPRGLSFTIGVVARMVEELDLSSSQDDLDDAVLKGLAAAVRRGFDTISKVEFATMHKDILSRVQLHRLYDESLLIFDLDLDDEL